MRNFAPVSLALVLALSPVSQLKAATFAGVTLPDTIQAGSTTLQLNGLGLRTKFMVKVYVAGLYLPHKSSDITAILQPDTPKRVVMHFVRGVSKNQLVDGFSESFHNNTPDAEKKLKAEIERLFAALEPVNDGDEITFSYLPGKGISLLKNQNEKLTISGSAFSEMLFSVWLGPKPPNAALKKGLLGQ